MFPIAAYWPFVFDGICFITIGLMLIVTFALGYYEKRIDKTKRSSLVSDIFERTSRVTSKSNKISVTH